MVGGKVRCSIISDDASQTFGLSAWRDLIAASHNTKNRAGTFSSSYRIGTYPSEVYILLHNFGLIVQKLQLEWSNLMEIK